MNKPLISVIIRVYNEEKWISTVLESLKKQEYREFETIIVDSQSTDNTINICKKYDCKIVSINKKDFNYSYASNVGAENASGDILCYISGHSVPFHSNYLGIAAKLFNDSLIGGVYGEVIALPDGSITEKLFNNLGYKKSLKEGTIFEKEIHPGILSCSNAFLRKDIWKKHKFKEELGHGGEDVEMAYRIIQEGKYIVKEPNLLVMHSHGSSFFKFIKEFRAWRSMYSDVENYIKLNE
ncbi:glycosyltransferase [Gottfriedia sp. S16(2024)]|uniref:glycosyltransferase family 2 protein n=1 Tax=Gottfriedia sp. S16(2024) TaxID=3162883 RepID=UPI003D24243A